jgi:hypothetical protein
MPPDVPQGHDVYRFSNTGEFLRLLKVAGLTEVAVIEHATVYSVSTRTLFGEVAWVASF